MYAVIELFLLAGAVHIAKSMSGEPEIGANEKFSGAEGTVTKGTK